MPIEDLTSYIRMAARAVLGVAPRSSIVVRLLLDVDRRSRVIVQPLTGMPADGEPERSAKLLDALLKGLAARPELNLRQSQLER